MCTKLFVNIFFALCLPLSLSTIFALIRLKQTQNFLLSDHLIWLTVESTWSEIDVEKKTTTRNLQCQRHRVDRQQHVSIHVREWFFIHLIRIRLNSEHRNEKIVMFMVDSSVLPIPEIILCKQQRKSIVAHLCSICRVRYYPNQSFSLIRDMVYTWVAFIMYISSFSRTE